jgi:hypothetical protein
MGYLMIEVNVPAVYGDVIVINAHGWLNYLSE